jgi:hypothetical protein
MFDVVRRADNEVLSDDILAACRLLCVAIADSCERRDGIISAYELDRNFSLADRNWRRPRADYNRLLSDFDNAINELCGISSGYVGCPLPSEADLNQEPSSSLIANWRSKMNGVPANAIYRQRAICGTTGWLVDGIIVNAYANAYQERLSLLNYCGLFGMLESIPHPRILEIGGGFGAVASSLIAAFPHGDYFICDLPESLISSGLYLTCLGHKCVMYDTSAKGVVLVPNYNFPFIEGHFDLVINTLSMSEMSEHQVDVYGAGISRLIGTTGKFFEQNQNNSHIDWCNDTGRGINCKTHLSRHFARSRTISAPFPVENGQVDIWEN